MAMSAQGYDDMGPRIDLCQDQGPQSYPRPKASGTASRPPKAKPSGGGLSVLALVVAFLALVLGAWALFSTPEQPAAPPLSADVVPGGTGERVAKLEKDVGQLMLRLVTLEKELETVRAKAGSVNQIAQLTAKVQALQERLDNAELERKMAGLKQQPKPQAESKLKPEPKVQAKPQAKPEAKPAPKAQPKPAAKAEASKKVYTVRRGDTLFTVAQRYQVRMRDLMKWNNIKRGDVLKVGQKLVIYK